MIDSKEQRIAVIRDILDRLDTRNISVNHYLDSAEKIIDNVSVNDNAQNHIEKLESVCNVCALGNILLSHIRLYNKVSIIDLGVYESESGISGKKIVANRDQVLKPLLDYFSTVQLHMIEVAFECVKYSWNEIGYDKADRCIYFGKQYDNAKDRLKAICNNIIANDGIFIPEQRNSECA
jgi:hypothetical protein